MFVLIVKNDSKTGVFCGRKSFDYMGIRDLSKDSSGN